MDAEKGLLAAEATALFMVGRYAEAHNSHSDGVGGCYGCMGVAGVPASREKKPLRCVLQVSSVQLTASYLIPVLPTGVPACLEGVELQGGGCGVFVCPRDES
ncbi:MAG: hypothetical protein OXT64_05595, partial [Gammaproteobacteria bacterium]|nr:hypothetical protein [Gammaproteobacteria bacterium]